MISSGFLYSPTYTEKVAPKSGDLEVEGFSISDSKNEKLIVQVEMFISRYKTD